MNILVIDNKPDDIDRIIDFCKRQKHFYDLVGPADLKSKAGANYDLIILSGGLWYKDPTQQQLHYGNELELITNCGIPILGICLGMQLIASAFGGELMELKQEYHGQKTVQLTDKGRELLNWSDNIRFNENHTEGVTKSPSCFEVLAISEECIEVIKHTSKPIIGVQFHPEKLNKKEHAEEVWSALLKLLVA